MRGKQDSSTQTAVMRGITPADAGKTAQPPYRTHVWGDHPRGCGENIRACCRTAVPIGSPPRMRGKPTASAKSALGCRITPADAGKTYFNRYKCTFKQDHPRGCGENPLLGGVAGFAPGSPPRMRGKPRRPRQCRSHRRITPADAGKTIMAKVTKI